MLSDLFKGEIITIDPIHRNYTVITNYSDILNESPDTQQYQSTIFLIQ